MKYYLTVLNQLAAELWRGSEEGCKQVRRREEVRRERRRKISADWRAGALGRADFWSFLRERRVAPDLTELRKSFHHWGTRNENILDCQGCCDGFARQRSGVALQVTRGALTVYGGGLGCLFFRPTLTNKYLRP